MARPSVYRRTPTPGGLEAIDEDRLAPFDLEMYANLNTGVLEEYMEAGGRRAVAARAGLPRRLLVLAVLAGVLFAVVNVVVAMRAGLLVAGAWYVTLLYALSRRLHPASTAAAGGAAAVAAATAAGVGLILPAAFVLSAGAAAPLVPEAALPTWWTAAAVAFVAGVAGVLVAAAVRRAWLVEDPFPFPGSTGLLQVLELSDAPSRPATLRSRQSLRLGIAGTVFGGLWALVRDLRPLSGDRAVLDAVLGRFHAAGTIGQPVATAHYTWLGVGLSPLMAGLGWFLRLPGSLVVLGGSAVVWLAAVPAAVWFDVPATAPGFDGILGLQGWWALGQPSALLAFRGPVRLLAAGALVGAAVTAILRESRGVGRGLSLALSIGDRPSALAPGRGWYEWPRPAAALAIAAALALLVVLVAWGDGGLLPAAVLGVALLVALGAGTAAALGTTGVSPTAGAGVVVAGVVALVGVLAAAPVDATLVAATLAGTAAVGLGAVAGAALLGYKTSLYVGGRPYTGTRLQLVVLPLAAAAAAATAVLLARAATPSPLVPGAGFLALPHAQGVAALGALIAEGTGASIFLLGVVFGIAAELVTDHGLLFAIGMFLPIGLAIAVALGGGLRHAWEAAVLDRRAHALGWSREKRTVKLLDTYLLVTGLIVGEALVGFLLLVAV